MAQRDPWVDNPAFVPVSQSITAPIRGALEPEPEATMQEDRLLSSAELAESRILPVQKPTLDTWRYRGEGPPYVKIGARVFYRESAVLAWIRAREVNPSFATSAAPA